MSLGTYKASAIAGNYAHCGSARRNRPWRSYWLDLALGLLRHVQRNIERAQNDGLDMGRAAFLAQELFVELQDRRSEAVTNPLPACASTPAALGLDE